jgi:hypothetical protein
VTTHVVEVEDRTQHFLSSVLPPAIQASMLVEGGREGGVEGAARTWEAENSKVRKRYVP